MLIRTMARIVHKNAVEHGWWEDDRDIYEVVALIHSEWSEALEEARAGRPMVYKLDMGGDEVGFAVPGDGVYDTLTNKPEGIAVELIDGCIRILDFFGAIGASFTGDDGQEAELESLTEFDDVNDELPEELPTLVALLHGFTSEVIQNEEDDYSGLTGALALALSWVKAAGYDPMEVMMEKHRYNVGRPYKHGKKF